MICFVEQHSWWWRDKIWKCSKKKTYKAKRTKTANEKKTKIKCCKKKRSAISTSNNVENGVNWNVCMFSCAWYTLVSIFIVCWCLLYVTALSSSSSSAPHRHTSTHSTDIHFSSIQHFLCALLSIFLHLNLFPYQYFQSFGCYCYYRHFISRSSIILLF